MTACLIKLQYNYLCLPDNKLQPLTEHDRNFTTMIITTVALSVHKKITKQDIHEILTRIIINSLLTQTLESGTATTAIS